MNSFILKILFSGLMVFSPSQDGHELTVTLLAANHSHLSDGTALPDHKPLLIARAGGCSGNCPTSDSEIAQYVYADQSSSDAVSSLESAVDSGGAWVLDASDISLQKASSSDPNLPALSLTTNARAANSIIPTTAAEREDLSWIADLTQLCSTCQLDSAVFGSTPPMSVAARFHLRNGRAFTYSIARMGANVTPAHFSRLDGTGSASSYTQAIASWVGAEIQISGSGIEIVEQKFNGDPGRAMTLTPDTNNKVEVAVLDLPPFVPPASSSNDAPQVGKHFESFYDLMATPPAKAARLVPRAGVAGSVSYPTVDWATIHPQSSVGSDLLSALRLDVSRSTYDRVLCPPGGSPAP